MIMVALIVCTTLVGIVYLICEACKKVSDNENKRYDR